MGLFSGLQMFGILCSVIKMKLVALWLEAQGVGLFGVYNSTVETVAAFSELGLRQSSVRHVAMSKDNPSRLAVIVKVVRRWSMAVGLLGAVVISGLAPLLAHYIFGDWSMCWGFVALSATMLLNALLMGEQSVLQGTGYLKRLAKGSFWGTFMGLIVSIPLFYYLRDDSVVPSIIVYAIFTLGFVLLFRYRNNTPADTPKLTLRETYKEGIGFVKLGISMSVAAFITNISHLVFLTYLNNVASMTEVGYFQAGYTLIIRYAGMIFIALGMEFFPRLSANSRSRYRVNLFVSHEITLLLLVLIPVILLFLLCREFVVDLLYSSEFRVMLPFVSWAMMCNIFKAVSWSMAFSIIARGDGRCYILTESIDAAIGLMLNILLYNLLGLTGIGIAYIFWFVGYCIIIGVVYFRKYHYSLSRETYKMILVALIVCFGGLYSVEMLPLWLNWILLPSVILYFVYRLWLFYKHN